MDRDEARKLAQEIRGVRYPCEHCRGMGARLYSSTATWRGGMGGASMTYDACDTCWGSGDSTRPWTNVRDLERKRRSWEAEECAKWLAERAGLTLGMFRPALLLVIAAIAKEANRRKLPNGIEPFWYARTAEALARTLRDLVGERLEG